MEYSVVIRTKNSGYALDRCLKSLRDQLLPPSEIIVVDSGSSDNSLAIAENYGTTIVHYPSNLTFNYSKALNMGVELATSKFILNLSSHVELCDKSTIKIMSEFWNKRPDCIAVSVLRSSQPIVNDQVESNFVYLDDFNGRAMYNFCALYKRSDWEKYHFNENIPRCEDQDWVYHFLKEERWACVISKPVVYYNNKYYNTKKDAWDYIVLGETVYPYFLSKNFLKYLGKMCWSNFIARDQHSFSYYSELLITLLKHKYIRKERIVSTYNEKLKG